jgi:hypothetical protein
LSKTVRNVLILSFSLVLNAGVCAAGPEDESAAGESAMEMKAREAHQLASSDMIYQNEEWKAIYYQNQRIIQLLKQIRDSLETIKSQGGVKNEVEN